MMKRYLKIGGIAVACLLVVLMAIPLFIDVNSFRPKIESEASSALGRPVNLGKLSLSVLSGSIGVESISIADDPAFSKSPFVAAKSLKVDVKMMPLIFHRQIEVNGIVLEEPEISLIRSPNGTWNFSSIGGAKSKSASSDSRSAVPQNLSVGHLEVKDGKVTVAKLQSSAKPQVYDKVNIDVKNFSFASRFPFELQATLPADGKVELTGEAGPINPANAAATPLDASVKVTNMNMAASGFVDPASGIAGLISLDGKLNSDGTNAKGTGKITCTNAKLSPRGSPAPKPINITYAVNTDLIKESGTITQGDVLIGKALQHVTGTFQAEGDSQVVNLTVNAPNMPVDDMEAMLPAFGVILPSGSRLAGGTLSAELAITGPVDNAVVTGPIRLSNTKLANFDLGAKLGALQAFTGKVGGSSDTTIQNFSTNARASALEGVKADAINLTIPALGVITGAGTVSPAGELNFRMLANLHGGVAGGLSTVALGNSSKGIAFSIQGTASNPKFIPDVGSVATGVATSAIQGALSGKAPGGVSSGVGALGGLLGGKKKGQ